MFQPSQPKKKPLLYSDDSIVESLRSIGSDVGSAVARDVVGKVGTDALKSLFGHTLQSGEIKQNEPVNFPKEREVAVPIARPETIRPAVIRHEDIYIKEQLQAVRTELKMLSSAVKNFHTEIQNAMMDMPPQMGIYHVTFFERLRSILKVLREQIEDSRTWLTMWTSRKRKRGYWGLYKKHGTQFGLSSERSLATQAG